MHLFFKTPENKLRPQIAKITKKKRSTMIVSLSKDMELKRADTIILSPSILEIVLSGLSTLKALRAASPPPPPEAKTET